MNKRDRSLSFIQPTIHQDRKGQRENFWVGDLKNTTSLRQNTINTGIFILPRKKKKIIVNASRSVNSMYAVQQDTRCGLNEKVLFSTFC